MKFSSDSHSEVNNNEDLSYNTFNVKQTKLCIPVYFFASSTSGHIWHFDLNWCLQMVFKVEKQANAVTFTRQSLRRHALHVFELLRTNCEIACFKRKASSVTYIYNSHLLVVTRHVVVSLFTSYVQNEKNIECWTFV